MNIWWIRRDLRLTDNPALTAAIREGNGVIPVFILDDHLLKFSAKNRQSFLFSGLQNLDSDLRRLGSGLVIRRGNPYIELCRLVEETHAHRIFAEADVSPYAARRDLAIVKQLDLHLVHGLGIHPTEAVKKTDGRPYTVFTPYKKAWMALPLSDHILSAPSALPPLPEIHSEPIPDFKVLLNFPAGEQEAHKRLMHFLDGPVFDYEQDRNEMAVAGTSSLSPYLRFGMLSARQAIVAARKKSGSNQLIDSMHGTETWISELIWREFYQSILYHFPHVLSTAFNPSFRDIQWRDSSQDLQAWKAGMTGYPVVDAGMRQLTATGWMHNRSRMITASFLVKHLLINWQEGERWFMEMLVDGDPAANNGGWQWTAGTGTDAAPYFRVFNPILQGKKFDPQGKYVRKWVPELANVPTKFIHTPWEMTDSDQQACGVTIGKDYPNPIVDHNFARQRVLAAYAKK